jgi:hypothetical protein
MVSQLIATSGARVDEPDNAGMTPLMHAAWAGQTDAINVLLVNSADINALDHNGLTPIDWAVRRDQRAAVKLLQEKGAEKTSLVLLWEGYHLGLEAQFAEAVTPLKAAVEKLPISGTRTFQAGKELFITTRPREFALIALAECELRSDNAAAASEHTKAAVDLQGAQDVVLYVRYDLTQAQLASGVLDEDNFVRLDFTLRGDALRRAAEGSPQSPTLHFQMREVTTHLGHSSSHFDRTLSGTSYGLFAR